jgi:hypothetical protein
MIWILLANVLSAYGSPRSMSPAISPEEILVANMLAINGSSQSLDQASACFENLRKEYLRNASNDRAVRLQSMTQALVSLNVVTASRVTEIAGELEDVDQAVSQVSPDKKDELFQAKIKQLFQDAPTSGAEFSGCKLSDGLFGNLEAIAFTGVVLGGVETIGNTKFFADDPSFRKKAEWVLAGSFVTLLVSGAIRHVTCNGPY